MTIRKYRCLEQQELVSGRFTLKVIQDEDIEDIRRWRNSQMDILRQTHTISPDQQVAYFEHRIWPSMNEKEPENILFSFFEGGKRIGYGGFVHIAWEHLRAEISFLLDPAFSQDKKQYKYYFSSYLSMIKKIGFSVLHLHRLYAETYDMREAHIRALKSNGFLLEGRMRQHIILDRNFVDSLIHGVINEK